MVCFTVFSYSLFQFLIIYSLVVAEGDFGLSFCLAYTNLIASSIIVALVSKSSLIE
jgi:hypothetical protein